MEEAIEDAPCMEFIYGYAKRKVILRDTWFKRNGQISYGVQMKNGSRPFIQCFASDMEKPRPNLNPVMLQLEGVVMYLQNDDFNWEWQKKDRGLYIIKISMEFMKSHLVHALLKSNILRVKVL